MQPPPLVRNISVPEGMGLCQRPGAHLLILLPRARSSPPPGGDHHRHAAANRRFTPLAVQEDADSGGRPATGGHHTNEEYDGAPPASEGRWGPRGEPLMPGRARMGDAEQHLAASPVSV